jgi:hypothetical protein
MGRVCFNNSSPNESLEGALGGIPLDASNTYSPPCMGGHIESQHPRNKERLACACQMSLYNFAGLTSDAYHGGPYGVQTLSERFIHNCGYLSFSNTLTAKMSLFATMKSNRFIGRCYNYGKPHDLTPRVHPSNRVSKRAFRYFQSFARWRPMTPLSSTISSKNSPPSICSRSCHLTQSILNPTLRGSSSLAWVLNATWSVQWP